MPENMAEVVQNIHVGPGILQLDPEGDSIEYKATEEGGTLSISRDVEFIEIDEAVGAVASYITGEECTFTIQALEVDAEKIKQALGHGTITTTPAGSAQVGMDELEFGGGFTLLENKLVYTAARRHNPNLNIIIELYKVVAVTDVEKNMQKTGKLTYQVQFRAINDMDQEAGQRLGKITIETEEEQ